MSEIIDLDEDDEYDDEPTGYPSTAVFASAILVGGLTTLFVASPLIRVFSSPTAADGMQQAGRLTGTLIGAFIYAVIGYGITLAIYRRGMALEYPETHSAEGKLNQLFEATKDVEVTDLSKDGFYKNATEDELVKFHFMLSKNPNPPRFAALVLEIRRRFEEFQSEEQAE